MCFQIVKKIIPSFITVSTLLFLLVSPAKAAIYAKIDGVDGESMAAGHENWINLISVTESIHRPGGAATGSTRTRASAVFDDIGLEKLLDKTSPKLRESLANGRVYPKVDIDITMFCEDQEVVYFSYELKNTQLSSIALKGMSSGGERPSEDFSLNFEEIKWTYNIIGSDCSSKGKVEASWNVEEGL